MKEASQTTKSDSRFSQYLDRDNFRDPSMWIRLALGVGYILLLNVLLPCIGVLALFQFAFILFKSKPNPMLGQVNRWLVDFYRDALMYLTCSTDRKPFPFTMEVGITDKSDEIREV